MRSLLVFSKSKVDETAPAFHTLYISFVFCSPPVSRVKGVIVGVDVPCLDWSVVMSSWLWIVSS